MRAIVSVFDKQGLLELGGALTSLGVELFSTGGTYRTLAEAGIPARQISDLTGFPEILDGRVKTLHPAVHGGILARRDVPRHQDELNRAGIHPIDMVIVNLYPFVATVSRPGVSLEEALENIDIGGPTMIRAAAKNYPHVTVVVDPADYSSVVEALLGGGVDMAIRRRLAQKAFQHVAAYDTAVARYLRQGEEGFPEQLTVALTKKLDLRYGENPHQKAAFYREDSLGEATGGIAAATQLGGKELSFNNILDADAAWRAASDFPEPTVAVVKHTNPCGLASHPDLTEAYRRALAGDPVSAFGGIVAVNRPLDAAVAQEISKTFYEIVITPEFTPQALGILQKKRDLRLLATGSLDSNTSPGWDFRRVPGGFLVQTFDWHGNEEEVTLKKVSERAPTEEEIPDLLFAWRAVKHVKSNAIVLARDKALLGMGAGQPNRVVSVAIALEKAGEKAGGSVLASDAFFPFPDGVEAAAKGGITAIIQPGGSVRDEEVIQTANRYHIAMVFTGVRHFRH
ncbi:MAG: bifunctional phosphoribosylaminoimidazolecarboxamide formyltransferase/IMP cyclohydrolase [Chloroflexi bacterium]|nr:bifunctional phosphoribosylaminoimidazolecarboxamide formyltransferase/IMP cyclohydrolase [Chloroflexota bacterium]